MNKRLQQILEKRYRIVWMDTPEYEALKQETGTIKDVKLLKKMASYLASNDPLYYTFHYPPLIEVAKTQPNPHNLFQYRGQEKKINEHLVLEIPMTEYFFKGMKTFYRPDDLGESTGPKWFGEETIAFSYAKLYHGGINVYQPMRTVRLLVYTNYQNLHRIIHYYQKNNKKYVFPLKIKTGVEISIFTQIDFYLKYNEFDDIWLNRKQTTSKVSGRLVPIFPGLRLWGRGKIDREASIALCDYCQIHGFDGYISYEHYTPFMEQGLEEIVLCDYYHLLRRVPDHPLDWMSWQSHLPIVLEEGFLLDEGYASKNIDFRIIRFWNNNKMDSKKNKLVHLRLRKLEDKFVMATLNVHSFHSVNIRNDANYCFRRLLLFLKNFQVDLLCLQEVDILRELSLTYLQDQLATVNYQLIFRPNVEGFGNAIVSRHPLEIESEIILPNDPKFSTRKATFFRLNHPKLRNYLFCMTHLEIGLRYTYRTGCLLPEEEIKQRMQFNANLRNSQLHEIMQRNPHFILGDCNFTPDDDEFLSISEKYDTYISQIKDTNPYGTITDFIFYHRDLNWSPIISLAINYRYSDHLPVLNVLET